MRERNNYQRTQFTNEWKMLMLFAANPKSYD